LRQVEAPRRVSSDASSVVRHTDVTLFKLRRARFTHGVISYPPPAYLGISINIVLYMVALLVFIHLGRYIGEKAAIRRNAAAGANTKDEYRFRR